MLASLWHRHAPDTAPKLPPVRPSADSLRLEAEQEKHLEAAQKANNRAVMVTVFTAAQSMKEESRVQAMLRGMLDEVDRGRGHDERH